MLQSPGFWEFVGALNPLEVLRKYLNDHHERKKDREYRQAAEHRHLEIENALRELDVIERIAALEREYGIDPDALSTRLRIWSADARGSLDSLGDFDGRSMINGGSAIAGIELPPSQELPPEERS
ncbi:MAG TPA: hypothetical protein VIY71_08535 [Solirubrobacterales bacterium]